MADPEDVLKQYGDDPWERGLLFPWARNKQTNEMSAAVPGFIHEPWEAAKRLVASQYGPGALSTSGNLQPIKDSTEVAGAVMAPSLGLNLAGVMPKNALGIFGGRLAKTADHAALAKAEEMAAAGAPREDIWNQTGWFQGADKKWRFEIPDDAAAITRKEAGNLRTAHRWTEATDIDDASIIKHRAERLGISVREAAENWAKEAQRPISENAINKAEVLTADYLRGRSEELLKTFDPDAAPYGVGQVLQHPDLYAAYPDLAGRPYERMGHIESLFTRGGHDPVKDSYYYSRINPDPKNELSTLLHEIQHGVQTREGFGPGANPAILQKDINDKMQTLFGVREKAQRALNAAIDNPNASDREIQFLEAQLEVLDKKLKTLMARDPTDEYRRSMGEVESRNVQKRAEMGELERHMVPPWESQDVPDTRQILMQYENLPKRAQGGMVHLAPEQHDPEDPAWYRAPPTREMTITDETEMPTSKWKPTMPDFGARGESMSPEELWALMNVGAQRRGKFGF